MHDIFGQCIWKLHFGYFYFCITDNFINLVSENNWLLQYLYRFDKCIDVVKVMQKENNLNYVRNNYEEITLTKPMLQVSPAADCIHPTEAQDTLPSCLSS